MAPKTRPELGKNPVGWLESLDNSSYPYKLRALISTGSPLTQWPDQNRIRNYIKRLDLSVYNGLTLNINSYYFDYILPAATWIESGGLSPVSDDSRFVWTPKLVDPPLKARPDRWWWIELGKRMGWGDIFRDEFKDPEVIQNHAGYRKGFTVDRFLAKKDNSLRAPIKVKDGSVHERGPLFMDKKFPTKSGKIELWTREMESKFNQYGLTAIPKFYMDPDIACENEKTVIYNRKDLILSPFQENKVFTYKVSLPKAGKTREKFPFYLLTGRSSVAIMGHTSHWVKKLNNVSPVQFCLIHPEAAESIGIKTGDKVKVSSPYGETVAIATISQSIRKDTVFIPYSFGEKAPFTEWHTVNFLTSMLVRCPVSGQVPFKGVRAAIEKIFTI
jgi:anaerobic selenocysteine-containing dehydrogenase